MGPKSLPELGRTIGKAMTEFRRASNDLKATFEREMQTLERGKTNRCTQPHGETARELADHVSYDLAPSETVWNPLQVADDHAAAAHGNRTRAGTKSCVCRRF
ncbi:MAG: twin-arginine translocase TatA/TatE family subunit [Acidobacteriota bacterium]